jgi:hypothetical protein
MCITADDLAGRDTMDIGHGTQKRGRIESLTSIGQPPVLSSTVLERALKGRTEAGDKEDGVHEVPQG